MVGSHSQKDGYLETLEEMGFEGCGDYVNETYVSEVAIVPLISFFEE